MSQLVGQTQLDLLDCAIYCLSFSRTQGASMHRAFFILFFSMVMTNVSFAGATHFNCDQVFPMKTDEGLPGLTTEKLKHYSEQIEDKTKKIYLRQGPDEAARWLRFFGPGMNSRLLRFKEILTTASMDDLVWMISHENQFLLNVLDIPASAYAEAKHHALVYYALNSKIPKEDLLRDVSMMFPNFQPAQRIKMLLATSQDKIVRNDLMKKSQQVLSSFKERLFKELTDESMAAHTQFYDQDFFLALKDRQFESIFYAIIDLQDAIHASARYPKSKSHAEKDEFYQRAMRSFFGIYQ
jgi:hypothetical protein